MLLALPWGRSSALKSKNLSCSFNHRPNPMFLEEHPFHCFLYTPQKFQFTINGYEHRKHSKNDGKTKKNCYVDLRIPRFQKIPLWLIFNTLFTEVDWLDIARYFGLISTKTVHQHWLRCITVLVQAKPVDNRPQWVTVRVNGELELEEERR